MENLVFDHPVGFGLACLVRSKGFWGQLRSRFWLEGDVVIIPLG